jgi:hypothetical protein
MKRVLPAVVILLVPAVLFAWPATMGVYFERVPGQMAYHPQALVLFNAYIYLHGADGYVTSVEYQLQTPGDPGHTAFVIGAISYPEKHSVSLGDPFTGHSIAYWPPLDAWNPGYNELCSLVCFVLEPCWTEGGTLFEYLLVIGPHPDSGELRGTYYPIHICFPIIGLTSIVCPEEPVATGRRSWGAIKAMLRE